MTDDELDAEIARKLSVLNDLKRERLDRLPPCDHCAGEGKRGIPGLMGVCSVCRGLKVNMGELYETRKKWGEF